MIRMKKSLVLMGVIALLFIVPLLIFLSSDSAPIEPEAAEAVTAKVPRQNIEASMEPEPAMATRVESAAATAALTDPEVVAQVGEISITRAQLSNIKYGRDDQSRLETLIQRAFLLLEFDRRDVELPAELVQQRVNEVVLKEFHGNRTAFLENLKWQGYTEEEFREAEADNMRINAMRAMLWRDADVNDRSMREREEAIQKWMKEMQTKIPVVYANRSGN
jgi:hypothetical protein